MSEQVPLNLDGPHSPETVRQAAVELSERARYIARATRAGAGGLDHPADLHDLLGALSEAIGRLLRVLVQATGFLDSLGDLAESDGGEPARGLVGVAAYNLGAAHGSAMDLAAQLGAAQQLVSHLRLRRDGKDD